LLPGSRGRDAVRRIDSAIPMNSLADKENSLPRPMNSLPVREKFPAPGGPGICVHRREIGGRIDAGRRQNGGKRAKFPAAFPAGRDFQQPRETDPAPAAIVTVRRTAAITSGMAASLPGAMMWAPATPGMRLSSSMVSAHNRTPMGRRVRELPKQLASASTGSIYAQKGKNDAMGQEPSSAGPSITSS